MTVSEQSAETKAVQDLAVCPACGCKGDAMGQFKCPSNWHDGPLRQSKPGRGAPDAAQSEIPMMKRASGRTIPDLTKREHVCEYQQSLKPRESGHVVLLEALRKALPILIGAIAFVDCKAVVAEVRAAIKQAEG